MISIYVGNMSWGISEQELEELFAEFGTVSSAKIIMDRESGRSKGFGFVEMDSEDAGMSAIEALNEKEIKGRALRVNKALPKKNKF